MQHITAEWNRQWVLRTVAFRSDVSLYSSKRTENILCSCLLHAKVRDIRRKWMKLYNDTKSVDDLPARTQRLTTKLENKAIVKIFEKNFGCFLRQARNLLSKKGYKKSFNTIRSTSIIWCHLWLAMHKDETFLSENTSMNNCYGQRLILTQEKVCL